MVTLQFSTTNGPGSALIRWLSWSQFSHVDIVMPNGYLLGARLDGGVQIRKPDYMHFSRIARFDVPDAPDAVFDAARSQIGKPYDIRAILAFPFRRDWRDHGHWFCSELVAWAFNEAGYPLLNTQHANRITPRDLTLSPLLKSK